MNPGDHLIEAIADAVALRLEKMAGCQQRLFSLEEAARYLGMTEIALKTKAVRRELPVIRLDSKLRFDRRDLDRFIDTAPREGV